MKNARVPVCDHGHLAKRKRGEAKAEHLPRRKGHGLALDVKSFCSPQAVRPKILQTELVVDVKWKRHSLPEDTRKIDRDRLPEQKCSPRNQTTEQCAGNKSRSILETIIEVSSGSQPHRVKLADATDKRLFRVQPGIGTRQSARTGPASGH